MELASNGAIKDAVPALPILTVIRPKNHVFQIVSP